MGIEPYSGDWTEIQAAHLLRRTVFGANFNNIQFITDLGFEGSIDWLLRDLDLPDPPVNLDFMADPDVPVGETWVDKPFNVINLTNNYRLRSLLGWTMGEFRNDDISIREKMVLFWHNHFVIGDLNDARYLYRYVTTLRNHALGNFKTLTEEITIDPAMLRYLNGNSNTKNAPNENYARELMELFTLGKGELAGPGDYTTFTEEDVIAVAKILTGWTDFGYNNIIQPSFGSNFRPQQHDNSTKVLSHRFGNVSIDNAGENEYKNLLGVIFGRDEVALFICRKLYRYFVYYKIDEQTEAEVIVPMAELLREENYELKPVIKILLSSSHFYEDDRIGCMIKNPIDYTSSIFTQFDIEAFETPIANQNLNLALYQFTALLQMQFFNPPSVAGWKAYYQEPSYYQLWINSVTLPLRRLVTDLLSTTGVNIGDMNRGIETLTVIENLTNPYDINTIISDLNLLMLPKPLSTNQKDLLKEIVLQGLPDFEWTEEYNIYLANPNDNMAKKANEDKLKKLFLYMMRMPEYQLS